MSVKKTASHLRGSSWRANNSNDTDNSDCSTDSEPPVHYIRNFLSTCDNRGRNLSPTVKNWQNGAVGLPPILGCENARSLLLPTNSMNTSTMARNFTSNNCHLMHHDYAERMNEQLTRDTFNSETGDLLDFGLHSDVRRSTVPDNSGENRTSNPVSGAGMAPYTLTLPASLNLGQCPIKKRPWLLTTNTGSKEAGRSESTSNDDNPCSSRSGPSDLSLRLGNWPPYSRANLIPPVLSKIYSTSAVSSSVPSTEVPSSSSSQRDRLKLRLKRINLSEPASSSYTPYTCSLTQAVRSTLWSTARDKASHFQPHSLSTDVRVQPSTSQADPDIDDGSPEIQFISMEQQQPSSSHSMLMSRYSERMKRRKRRKMHLSLLGKTYVSDEVIVVDDGHQEPNSRSPHEPYKASVPGPRSHRRLNSIAVLNAKPERTTPTCSLTPPYGNAAVSRNSMASDGIVEGQDGNEASDDRVEVAGMPDGSVTNPERSATPDSVVALTPIEVRASSAMPASCITISEEDGASDTDTRMETAGSSCSAAAPGQVAPTLLTATPCCSLGISINVQASQDSSETQLITEPPQSMAMNLTLGSAATGPTPGNGAVEEDLAKAPGNVDVAGPSQQYEDHQMEAKPTIRVKDNLRDEAVFTETVNKLKSKLMSLTAILECPVCLEYVGPPIYQCRRGHIVCGLCKPKLMYCPTCRSGFSEYRNLIAEMFAERLDYPCKNAHLGCESTFTLKDKEDHEANCAFRFYKCILCPWKGLHGELLPHLMRDHPGKVGHGAEQEILLELGDMTMSANQNWIVSAMNEMFRVNFILAKRQNNMQIMGSVQFIGPRRCADDFIYTFDVKSEEFDQHCIFSRKTHSDLDKCYTYYTNGDGFFINNSGLFSSGGEDDVRME